MTYEELTFEYNATINLYDKDGNKWPDGVPVPTDAEVLQTLHDPAAIAWDVFIDERPHEAVPDHGRYPLENEKQVKYLIVEATSDNTIQPIRMLDSFEEAAAVMKTGFLHLLYHILNVSDEIEFVEKDGGLKVSAFGDRENGRVRYRFDKILKNDRGYCDWYIYNDLTEDDNDLTEDSYEIWSSVIKLEV